MGRKGIWKTQSKRLILGSKEGQGKDITNRSEGLASGRGQGREVREEKKK